jgi:hypothetical protein
MIKIFLKKCYTKNVQCSLIEKGNFLHVYAISPIITHQEYLNVEEPIGVQLPLANPWYTTPMHEAIAKTRYHLGSLLSHVRIEASSMATHTGLIIASDKCTLYIDCLSSAKNNLWHTVPVLIIASDIAITVTHYNENG